MRKPRPAPRIDVCNVTAKLNPHNQQHQNTEHFKKGRFQYYAPTHNSAVAIGSTKLNSHDQEETHILDASTVVYHRGEYGERKEILIALADGCNKTSDKGKNTSTGLVAKAACDYITHEASSTDDEDQLITKAINAGKKSLETQPNPDDKSSSTLNVAVIDFNKGSFVNIGDGLLIVIDGISRQVKKIINPSKILNETAQYKSATVQELHQKAVPELYLEKHDCTLQTGDIVILASHGFAEVLPSTIISGTGFSETNTEKINYIEYKIQLDILNIILIKVFRNLKEKYHNSKAPAFAIANEFVNVAIAFSFEQKQKKIAFVKNTETFLKQFKTLVIDRQISEYQNTIKKIQAEIAANFAAKKSHELAITTETVPPSSFALPDPRLKESDTISDSSEKHVEQPKNRDVRAALTASLKKLTKYTNKTPQELQTVTTNILRCTSIFFPSAQVLVEVLDDPRNLSALIGAVDQLLDEVKPTEKNHLDQCIDLVTQDQNSVYEEPIKVLHNKNNIKTSDATSTDDNYISYFSKQFVEKFQQMSVPTEKTIKDFKQWILNTNGRDDEYLKQLNEYLIIMNINETLPYSFLQNDLDINKMQFGDDTTIAVAYVPDQQLELVRAMIEYPNNRNQLWNNLLKTNPTTAALEKIYDALRCERYINPAEQTNTDNHQTFGQSAEHLSHNTEHSYSEDELLDVEIFLMSKVKLLARIANLTQQEAGETKETAHKKLKQLINGNDLSVLERCCLYNEIPPVQFLMLNQHRRAGVDRFFGIKITHTWSQTIKEIRDSALVKLRSEIEELRNAGKFDRALALLNKLIEASLFNTHRTNFKITGAFGETAAVKEIRQLINSVRAAKNIPSYSL